MDGRGVARVTGCGTEKEPNHEGAPDRVKTGVNKGSRRKGGGERRRKPGERRGSETRVRRGGKWFRPKVDPKGEKPVSGSVAEKRLNGPRVGRVRRSG